ncbi:CobW family GTP-binding protein [Marinobacter lacisalsi]|uniref:CobW family GTP-binding protein n=1 Tax=Marinobacter lacisalsi TaxID=475979 RepID=A0ABV8QCR3_9GAMM
MQLSPITAVPTNIITGFLGVGKTTAISHLLQHKPDGERWAVLVNEFGEVGVDGSLFQGLHGEDGGVYVREVPGGCMCCTAGLPMQIALNQLLARARPHRLLIEPTGLGHPEEVLRTLAAEHYRDVLAIQKTVTLVDARKLADTRYTGHATFNQQIAIADVVVGNKQDLYGEDQKQQLETYVRNKGSSGAVVDFVTGGAIDPRWLLGPTAAPLTANLHPHQRDQSEATAGEPPLPASGYLSATNEGEGYRSIGWRFEATRVFDYQKLFSFLTGLEAERMKAFFITDRGVFGYNLTSDSLTEIPLDDALESRIEIIAPQLDEGLESQLLACVGPDR